MSVAKQALQQTVETALASTALDDLELRCWARAYLVGHGMMFLQGSVDVLQDMAVSFGLVDLIGQDAVQSIMVKAFQWRDRSC